MKDFIYLLTPKWSGVIGNDPRAEPLCFVQTRLNDDLDVVLRIPAEVAPGVRRNVMFSFPARVGAMSGTMYEQGGTQKWGLRKLGPGVWAVDPSIQQSGLHAYLVLCDVPDPAPWKSAPAQNRPRGGDGAEGVAEALEAEAS